VGIHSDEEITFHKREPVMKNEERIAAVRACKWVDEIEFGVPYSPSVAILDRLKCDFAAHGDDIAVDAKTGKSAYDEVERKGRLKVFKRTPGVSTTTLIERLLLASKSRKSGLSSESNSALDGSSSALSVRSALSKSWSSFLATSHRLSAFSSKKVPKPSDRVVYIDGDFDLFHVGHITVLQECRKLGDFVYVGVYEDAVVQSLKGQYFPMMNLQERLLTVLQCKYVDEVVMGSPYVLTDDMLNTLNISVVVTNRVTTTGFDDKRGLEARYGVALERGIVRDVESTVQLTTDDIMDRILRDHEKVQEQNMKRSHKELSYLKTRKYVQES